MSQSQVSEFFAKRKRCDGLQPSKRRKAVISDQPQVEATAPVPTKTPPVGARTRSRISSKVSHPVVQIEAKTRKNTRASRSKTAVPVKPSNQKSIEDVLGNWKVNNIKKEDESKSDLSEAIKAIPTASSDNHNASPPCTPTKTPLLNPDADSATSKKRSRLQKNVVRDLFKEEMPDPGFSLPSTEETSNRKVVSPRRLSANSQEKPATFTFTGKEDTKQKEELAARLEKLAKDAFTPPAKVEPGPAKQETEQKKMEPIIDETKLKNLKSKVEKNPEAMKTKLAQCGKLAELKQKLLEMSKQKSPRKKSLAETVALSPSKSRLLDVIKNSPIKAASVSPSKLRDPVAKAPAYERFSSLTEPVPPGLTLPKHYKLLHDFFTSTDTVVSMLHKRAEVCTFSKLRKAVQEMTHKTFEERNLGQIKHVYPTAFTYKQEKNVPCYGKKVSGYQLTIEANLTDDPWSNAPLMKTKDGRPDFTAQKILERKDVFHRKLLDKTIKFHKEFLANMERPLNISDKKITRWHPKFALEESPEIEASDLPKPPNVQVITSAKDALEQARAKCTNPRVIKALESVAAKNAEEQQNILKSQTDNVRRNSLPKQSPVKASSDAPAVKGVSQSLLERIRAKEAQKQEQEMYCSTADVKKKERMARLPELARVLRSFFVTQKKPALTLQEVTEKLSDSYSSSMGLTEAETHLTLLTDVVPEWVSLVKVKRGTFVKIDRNKDVNIVIDKLHKQAK